MVKQNAPVPQRIRLASAVAIVGVGESIDCLLGIRIPQVPVGEGTQRCECLPHNKVGVVSTFAILESEHGVFMPFVNVANRCSGVSVASEHIGHIEGSFVDQWFYLLSDVSF